MPKDDSNLDEFEMDDFGMDALQIACAEGNPSKVRKILANNPDVNPKSNLSNFTPLHYCVSGTDGSNRQEIIELLHAAGANLEAKDFEKKLTPLGYAALRNKPLCGKTLIQCGANVHATDKGNSATPLHGAAYHGNLEVAKVLLEGRADPTLKDIHVNTPIWLACSRGHTALYLETVRSWLDKGFDQNVRVNNDGATVLMLPAEDGHVDIVRALLDKGANELLNQDVKCNTIRKNRPRHQNELLKNVRNFLRKRQRQPHIVERYFSGKHVRNAVG